MRIITARTNVLVLEVVFRKSRLHASITFVFSAATRRGKSLERFFFYFRFFTNSLFSTFFFFSSSHWLRRSKSTTIKEQLSLSPRKKSQQNTAAKITARDCEFIYLKRITYSWVQSCAKKSRGKKVSREAH